MGNLAGWHLVIILVLVVLLFGSTKIPALARSLGQSLKILRAELGQRDNAEPAAHDPADSKSTGIPSPLS